MRKAKFEPHGWITSSDGSAAYLSLTKPSSHSFLRFCHEHSGVGGLRGEKHTYSALCKGVQRRPLSVAVICLPWGWQGRGQSQAASCITPRGRGKRGGGNLYYACQNRLYVTEKVAKVINYSSDQQSNKEVHMEI